MTGNGPTPAILLASTPLIANVLATTANEEVAYTFPANTRRFTLKARIKCNLKFSFNAGQTSTLFTSLEPGQILSETDLDLNGVTIYVSTDKANQVLEILSWQR